MPFITEEIWQTLPHEGESIMVSEWPKYDEALNFAEEAAEFEMVMKAIKGIRTARANANVPPSRKASVYIKSKFADSFIKATPFFERLASASSVTAVSDDFSIERALNVVTDDAIILLPMDELVDREKELARLNKEMAACQKDLDIINSKLGNEGFVAKAPEKVILAEREKLAKATERMAKIKESLAAFEK